MTGTEAPTLAQIEERLAAAEARNVELTELANRLLAAVAALEEIVERVAPQVTK